MEPLGRRGALFTEIVLEVFRLNRLLLDAGDELAAPAGLTSARWQVLGVVEHGPASVAQVARTMGLTRQSVQQTANSLAREGLSEWVENPRHRRAKLIRLTSEGREALDAVVSRHAAWANGIAREHRQNALESSLAQLRALRASLETGGTR